MPHMGLLPFGRLLAFGRRRRGGVNFFFISVAFGLAGQRAPPTAYVAVTGITFLIEFALLIMGCLLLFKAKRPAATLSYLRPCLRPRPALSSHPLSMLCP